MLLLCPQFKPKPEKHTKFGLSKSKVVVSVLMSTSIYSSQSFPLCEPNDLMPSYSDLNDKHMWLMMAKCPYKFPITTKIQGVSKKMSFTELSICGFATNITNISPQLAAGSPIAKFDKTQFF